MIGVDYDLFWTLNPKSLTPFVKAFSMKQELNDAQMWNMGIYVRMAVASAMNKSVRYPVKPYGIKKEQEMDSATIKEKFLQRAKEINARFRKEDKS